MTQASDPTVPSGSPASEPAWFTGAVWAACAVGALALIGRLATLRHGYWVSAHDVIGADFATFWSAARLATSGRAVQVFSIGAFDAAQRAMLGSARQFAFWSYPPPTLLLYAAVARLPYLAAYSLWMAASAAVLAPVAWAVLKSRRDVVLLLLSPAVAFDVLLGQNGLLTCAILLGGLLLIERRPGVAGLLLGLLALKPQMALLLPVAVVAGRRWRAMGGAAASAGALCAASVLAFGVEPWRAFFAHTLPAQAQMLRHGQGWFQNAMPTAFMAARLLGAPWQVAALAQLPFLAFGAWLVWRAFRTSAAASDRAVVLILASSVASPQLFNYDLVAASAALLLWVRRDPRPATYALALAGLALPALCVVFSGFGLAFVSPLLLAAIAWRAAAATGIAPSGLTGGPVQLWRGRVWRPPVKPEGARG